MNPNWLGVISTVLSFVAFFLVYRIAKKKPLKSRIWLCLIAIFLSLPGASFAIYYAHLFPEKSWYYQFRSITGTEFLIIFIGFAGGLVASLLPRIVLIIPLFGTAVLSTLPFIKPFIGPIPDGKMNDRWHQDICLQSTSSTCGAATTASIIHLLGGTSSESELAAEAHSYAGGTEAWYLARSIRKRGFEVEFDFTDGFTPEKGLPAVVGVLLETNGHFIAILGKEGEKFIVGDPIRGRELLTKEKLLERYIFTGFHMRIR